MKNTKIITWNKRDNREYRKMPELLSLLEGRNYEYLDNYDLPLEETVKKVKESDFFIGTDGFLLHLCSYLGLSGIAIWNKENFVKNFPHKNVVAISSMAEPTEIIKIMEKFA